MPKVHKYNLRSKSKRVNKVNLKKARIAHYLKKGITLKDACTLVGVSKMEMGEMRSDVEFDDFVKRCETECEIEHIDNISTAGSMGSWQASAWYLERRFPEKYGKKDIVKHEYEVKFMTFQNVILKVINEVEPNLRHKIMQKLRSIDVEKLMIEDKTTDAETVDAEIL